MDFTVFDMDFIVLGMEFIVLVQGLIEIHPTMSKVWAVWGLWVLHQLASTPLDSSE